MNLVSYKEEFSDYIDTLQNTICYELERIDTLSKFKEDEWFREGGGGGKTRIISDGKVFEKGGVNVSKVYGKLPDSMQKYLKVPFENFFACGLSLVLHPYNPFVPTSHANFRYFELYDNNGDVSDQWFAGGIDLTPYYIFDEDITYFHNTLKIECDKYSTDYYQKYKNACDDYFYNPHRNEARGVGGLFFDYLRPDDKIDSKHWFDYTTSIGSKFIESYCPIVEKRKETAFEDKHKEWQNVRRGRYVEFNLIHDKGTAFGLKTKGRIESILMSLPKTASWIYDFKPASNSEEEKLIKVLENPKNWI